MKILRRFDESQKDDFERALKLGHDNADCLRQMQGWCKSVKIKRVSEGLYAQMSGLPIATHSLGCPYVHGESQSMNLRWIFSEFLIKNCAVCSNQIPNGNTTWGTKIIEDNRVEMQKYEQENKKEAERISQLRSEMRIMSKKIAVEVESESQRIIEFLEAFFDENEKSRKRAAESLKQSAHLAADIFPDVAVNLIFGFAISTEFSGLILPICSELAAKRADLSSRLYRIALDNIEKRLHVELSASVLEALGNSITYPLDEEYIEKLILAQDHYHHFGIRGDSKLAYPKSTAVLIHCFDAEPNSVQHVISRILQKQDDHSRVQLCGALKLIQEERPQIVLNLLDNLVKALEMHEDAQSGIETPSGKIIHLLQAVFRDYPERVDKVLSDSFIRVRPAVQEDIIKVYRDQFFDCTISWDQRLESKKRDTVSKNEEEAIKRLLGWAKDDRIEIDIRSCAIEAFEMACDYATAGVLPHFNALLGYVALISGKKNLPVSPPQIFIPGQKNNPQLEELNNFNRKQEWEIFKQRLQKCLEEICENRPTEVFELVADCLNQSYDQMEDSFRATCVSLLGQLGKEYQLRVRVMPLIWRALMDYSSALVRAVAINATIEMFSHSSATPPPNLVDVIIIHLQDTYVAVHQSALRAVSWHANWFDEKQSVEVLSCLMNHLKVYKSDKYQLDDICDGLMAVARNSERLKVLALHMVESVYPTGEELVDSKIAGNLLFFCKPTEAMAHLVAKNIITYLGNYERDLFNHYAYSKRFQMLWWLHNLPEESYQRVEQELLAAAIGIAKRDAWEACYFASIFSLHRAFNLESAVLESAVNGLPQEPRHDSLRKELRKLASISAGNAALQNNDKEKANNCFCSSWSDV